MIRIQLTDPIEGYLDLAEDTDFPITFSVADIKDITKRKGTFSKSIKLAGNKNNNKLLNNYFDVNVTDGTFNVKKLTKCVVIEDGNPFLENMLIQLISVNKVQTSNKHDEFVEYTIIIKNSISDFFTQLGKGELSDLDFSGYEHYYNTNSIEDSWYHNIDDVYKYIMPYNPTNNYVLKEWQPGIYLKQYFDRMISNVGFTYEWPELSDHKFDKMIIPYNGEEPKISYTLQERHTVDVELKNHTTVIEDNPTAGFLNNYTEKFIIDDEIKDDEGEYNPSNGNYTNSFYLQGGTGNINFNYEITYDIILENMETSPIYALTSNVVGTNYNYFKFLPIIAIKKDVLSNSFVGISSLDNSLNGIKFLADGSSIPVGETTIYSGTSASLDIVVNNLVPGNVLQQYVGINVVNSPLIIQQPVWKKSSNINSANANVRWRLKIKTVKMIIKPSVTSFGYNSLVNLNQFIPKKIKQTDLFKTVVQMYNLFIDIKPEDPTKLLFSTRDEYYDKGKTVDWTKLLNKDKEQDISFLSELTKKSIKLTYKQDAKDPLLEEYLDQTNEIYGQVEYTFDSEHIKEEEVKEIIFSPTVITDQTTFGAVVPTIIGPAPKNNVRLLYDGGLFDCGNFSIANYPGNVKVFNEYPLFSNFDHPTDPSYSSLFGQNDYNYASIVKDTNNNLFNLHWRRTFNQINNSKILTAYFDLDIMNIYKMELNDKIRIDNSYWNINKIADFNPNKDTPTKVELLSIDDELSTINFITKYPDNNDGAGPKTPIKPGTDTPGTGASTGFKDVNTKHSNDNNINMNGAMGDIAGVGNVISRETDIVSIAGDDNIVNSKFGQIVGRGNKVNSNAIILGDDNEVVPGIKNALIIGDNTKAVKSNSLQIEDINYDKDGMTKGNSAIKIDDLGNMTFEAPTIDFGGTTTVINMPGVDMYIEKTYAELTTLKSTSTLVPGTTYFISDKDIWLIALSTNELSSSGWRRWAIIKNQYYTPNIVTGFNNQHFLGIYGQTIAKGSVPNSDSFTSGGTVYYVIWGGKMWTRNNSGGDFPGNNSGIILSGWTEIPRTNTTYYKKKIFDIKYNFDNDTINSQADDRGNIITGSINDINATDWGNNNIYRNKSGGIYNNYMSSLPVLIYDNYVYLLIINNSKGNSIYNNIGLPNIIGNSGPGFIHNNKIPGSILNNESDDIIDNKCFGNIAGNNVGKIINNSNNGPVIRNISTTSIDIKYNTNNGSIGNINSDTTRIADVTDTIVNK